MMYISVFPIAISVRNTNVYEEKSLGIYGSMDEQAENGKDPSYIGAHLRKQLSFDLWYVFLGLFIVAIAEGPRIEDTNDNVSEPLWISLLPANNKDGLTGSGFHYVFHSL